MNWNRIVFGLVTCALIVFAQSAVAQVAAGALTWHRELNVAMAEAKNSGKSILAFFADPKSEASNKSWSALYDGSVVPVIQSSYVPLLIDSESQKALMTQLGITEPGVAVIYSADGAAVRKLSAQEIADLKGLEDALKSSAKSNGAAGPAPAGGATASAQGVATPAAASTAAPAPVGGNQQSAVGSADQFANAMPADKVTRDLLEQEVTITGTIEAFEPSGGPRIPFIATLVARATDPVEVVYWEETANQLHAGRQMPKKGDRISAKGKLTDYKGRLQIKANSPRQVLLH